MLMRQPRQPDDRSESGTMVVEVDVLGLFGSETLQTSVTMRKIEL